MILDYQSPPKRELPPVISIILIFAIVFLGFMVIGPMIGFFLTLPFFPGDMFEYLAAIEHITDHPELKISYYVMQGCATAIGLIIGPVLFLKTQQKSVAIFFVNQKLLVIPAILTALIVVVFMAANSFFVEWNTTVKFPEFLKEFEAWAKEMEARATQVTEILTHFDSIPEVILAMIVIALLPAIGEELVFRGLIQNEFFRGTKNIHVAIWVSAILFSAIHVQFFGFVPRMLLGALFGYLYYWSGSLWVAMLAHFVNNGMAIIGMYLNQMGYLDFDVESPEAAPVSAIIFSAILTGALLYAFKKYYKQKHVGTA
jgi:membrane protease YdiL (CAAX protease family)